MPPLNLNSLTYVSTNVHSWGTFSYLASHSTPGCLPPFLAHNVLMVTTAALQAWPPFVCSAFCAMEVINAIIRYAGRVCECTSIVTHAWLSLGRKRAETQNVQLLHGDRLAWMRFRWFFLWQVVTCVHLPFVCCCCFSSWLNISFCSLAQSHT